MPEQERLDDAIGILRNHTEVVCLVVVLTPSRPVLFVVLLCLVEIFILMANKKPKIQ